jgi:hypothetical protein
MLDALEAVAGPAVRARVRFERDERIAGIVANWPKRRHRRARRALGLKARASFEAIIRQYIDDCRRQRAAGAERTDRMNQIDLKAAWRSSPAARRASVTPPPSASCSRRRGRAVGHRRRAAGPGAWHSALGRRGRARGQTVELTDDAPWPPPPPAVARLGRIDILVNNAGITGGNGPTWELDPAVWRRVIEVNLIGPT